MENQGEQTETCVELQFRAGGEKEPVFEEIVADNLT